MPLQTVDRQRIWRGVMRYASRNGTLIPVTKADLQAAINAVDDWCDANAASFNTALPQPFRGAATPEMKAFLLAVVALSRFMPGLVQSILGEVD